MPCTLRGEKLKLSFQVLYLDYLGSVSSCGNSSQPQPGSIVDLYAGASFDSLFLETLVCQEIITWREGVFGYLKEHVSLELLLYQIL